MFDRFKRRLANLILGADTANYNPYNDALLSMVGTTITNYDENAETFIKKGYQINPDVYSVVTQMAKKCASIPFNIKKVKDEKARDQLNRIKTSTHYQHLIKRVELEIKAYEDGDIPMPLERPNANQTWAEFIALSVVFFKTTGNCFWYMLKPDLRPDAEPTAIYCLPSHQTYIVLKDNPKLLGNESPIDCYKLIESNQFIDFNAENVIHIKNPNPDFDLQGSHLYGQSDLKAVLRNIQSSNDGLDANVKRMKNSGVYGFLHSKGQNIMTQPQAESIRERMQEMDKDPKRLSNIAGTSAEIGFTRISLTTDELKPFDYLNYDQKAICNVLGWSVKLLNNNEDSSGLNNGAMDQERKRVITDTAMPLLGQFSEALNSRFFPLFKSTQGACIDFDATELPEMQADMEKLSKWLYQGLDRGVYNRVTVQGAMQFPIEDTPEMRAYTVAQNIQTLEDAIVPMENDLTDIDPTNDNRRI